MTTSKLMFYLQHSNFASRKNYMILRLDSDCFISFLNTIFPNDMILHNFKLSSKYVSFSLSSTCWQNTWFFHHSPNTQHTLMRYLRSCKGCPSSSPGCKHSKVDQTSAPVYESRGFLCQTPISSSKMLFIID